MRIIGGTLRGRRIEPPLSLTTRPMMDRIREALFNILAHRDWGNPVGGIFDAAHALDAFCGTGALAFEALSWGAARATLFDNDRQALQIASQNAAALGVKNKCDILLADALHPPRCDQPCKLVFLAPPYRRNLIPPALQALDNAGWIAEHAVIVAETAKKETLATPENFTLAVARHYSDTMLHFFVR